jgi:hypothetical protein
MFVLKDIIEKSLSDLDALAPKIFFDGLLTVLTE